MHSTPLDKYEKAKLCPEQVVHIRKFVPQFDCEERRVSLNPVSLTPVACDTHSVRRIRLQTWQVSGNRKVMPNVAEEVYTWNAIVPKAGAKRFAALL